jgi:O-antigen ligase
MANNHIEISRPRQLVLKGEVYQQFPILVWVAFAGTMAAGFLFTDILPFNISGLAWAGALLIALIVLSKRAPYWRFPVHIWLPWFFLLLLYLPGSLSNPLDSNVSPIQRSSQLVTPMIVAVALSTYRISPRLLIKFVRYFRIFLVLFWFLAIITHLEAILALGTTDLAGQAMTSMLGCTFFLCRYFLMRRYNDLVICVLMVTMPILAVTRTVIAVTLMLPNIVLVPLSLLQRFVIIGVSLLTGVSVFFLPQVQKKMFQSGSGQLNDLSFGNEELSTSGRAYLWDSLFAYAQRSPWFGYGTGQGETFCYKYTPVGYPHNDWLLTYTDYGAFGVIVFLLCNLWMMLDCWRHARKVRHPTVKLFFYAGASSFIPFMLVMFTDNIMVYASFFGILQYTIIGLAYGSLNTLKKRPKRKRKRVASSLGTPLLTTAKVDLPSTG